jgi:chromosome segregation ATPase
VDPKAKKLLSAVLSPLTLVVGAAGTATFVLSGLWWVLPLTAGVAGLVSATQFRTSNDAFVLPQSYRDTERALGEQIDRIEAALEAASESIRGCLSDLPRQLAEMRGKVGQLLERQARIDAFVAEEPPAAAQRELSRLEASLASARTPEAREKFASALKNKQAEADSRDGLRASSERIAAELAEIESALGSALSKLFSLQTLHGEEVRAGGAGITSALGEVLTTVGTLEQALSETFDPQRRRVRG